MKKELKIGILIIAVLSVSLLIINYLRGKDVFDTEYELSSFYDDVQGLLPSSPVLIKGFKAGIVQEVEYNPEAKGFDVLISVKNDFKFPKDSKMTIYSADLMGGKAIRIDFGQSDTMAVDGDFLEPSISPDMLASLAMGIEPLINKGADVLDDLKITLTNINETLGETNRKSIQNTLRHVERTIANAEAVSASVKGKSAELEDFISSLNVISAKLAAVLDSADSAVTGISGFAGQLNESDIKGAVESIRALLVQLQDEEGTLGKLLNDNSVYHSVDSLLQDVDHLVKKIEENPKKYIRISVF